MLKRIILVFTVLMAAMAFAPSARATTCRVMANGFTSCSSDVKPAYACGAEDDPTWAWSRCGNHKRGVIDLRTGRKRVVNRCEFARLWMNGNAGGPALRGDRWAVDHPGCAVRPTDINRGSACSVNPVDAPRWCTRP